MSKSRIPSVVAASLLASAGMAHAQAPAFPSKPVRIVVPYAPGGATDIVARIVGEEMRKVMGQPFIIESKVGAGGIVALEEMLKSKDGYTLMVGNVTTNTITPIIDAKKLRFDYKKEVVPIQRLADVAAVVVTTAVNFAPKNLKELVELSKKMPGKVRYGTVGPGSYPHFDAAYLARKGGNLDMNAIHNKAGASGVINDLVTGDTQFAFLNAASTISMVKAGKLKAIAVIADKRLAIYPDVPTMAESGFADVGTIAWQSLFAPAATPKPVLEALFKASTAALAAPAVKEAFAKQNFIAPTLPKSLEESAKWLTGEFARWTTITNEVKLDLN